MSFKCPLAKKSPYYEDLSYTFINISFLKIFPIDKQLFEMFHRSHLIIPNNSILFHPLPPRFIHPHTRFSTGETINYNPRSIVNSQNCVSTNGTTLRRPRIKITSQFETFHPFVFLPTLHPVARLNRATASR